MRCMASSVPFGGIHAGFTDYMGIPDLSSNNQVSTAAFTDSLLISAGALVAHCDPGTIQFLDLGP